MPETITNISQQITDFWNKYDKAQKIKIALLGFILIATLGIVIFLTTRPQMAVLFSGLEYKESAEIQEALNQQKIMNKTIQNGTAIEVRQRDLDKAKLALARENIPKAGFTFEDALNANGMGTTESQKRETFQYLKEQELSRAIREIEGVNDAVVKLTIPNDNNFFIESKQKASASVKLDLRSNLSKDQVMGVVRFVAGSVSGLDIKDINVVDNQANLLYAGEDEKSMSLNTQYEMEQQKKKDIEKQVESVLAPLYDDVRITSNITMKWDKKTETQQNYTSPVEDSNKGLITQEQKESSKVVNGSQGQEPGLNANGGDIPEYNMGDNTTSEAKVDKSQTSYAVNRTDTILEEATGVFQPKDSSLSIMVYNKTIHRQDVMSDEEWQEYQSNVKRNIESQLLEDNHGLVTAIQNGTGISDVKIVRSEIPIFIDRAEKSTPIENYIIVIILLAIIGLLFYALIKRTEPEEITEFEPELSVEEMLASTQKQQEAMEPIDYSADSEVKRQIEKFVDEKPEAVAQLLRNWLSEEWE